MESSFIFSTSMVLLAIAAVGLLLNTGITVSLALLALVAVILSLFVANGGAIP